MCVTQEALQLVRAFSHRLYKAYEQYVRDASENWLSKVEGGLVRQVNLQPLARWQSSLS